MRIVFTGGGTAGHVTPNIALINELRARDPHVEVYYIGSIHGIEQSIVAEYPFIKYYEIHAGKLRRYLSLENLKDFLNANRGYLEAYQILKMISPDIVFSKGGYVALPVATAAHQLKIPVVSHESDLTPGLANKLSLPAVTKLCVTFPDTVQYVKEDKAVVTGTPIRKELYEGDADKARAELGFDSKPVILVMGGSLGSVAINNAIRGAFDELTAKYNVIHLVGKKNLSDDPHFTSSQSYRQFEFISKELPDYLALAHIIISRAGSNAIHEFLALKKPMLLIPLSKKASRGDQVLNAESFAARGLARVIEEEDVTNEKICLELSKIEETYSEMVSAMESSESKDGTKKIVDIILENKKVKKSLIESFFSK